MSDKTPFDPEDPAWRFGEGEVVADVPPLATYSLTSVDPDELARLRRIEQAARDVLTRIESREPPSWLKAQLDEASLDALRAALSEEK